MRFAHGCCLALVLLATFLKGAQARNPTKGDLVLVTRAASTGQPAVEVSTLVYFYFKLAVCRPCIAACESYVLHDPDVEDVTRARPSCTTSLFAAHGPRQHS